jgi:glycosyltransferase involved in cell wall biosynthesis
MTQILFAIDSLTYGGAERQLCLLLKYLPKTWSSRVIALGGGPYAQVLQDQGNQLDVFTRKYRYDLLPVVKFWRTIVDARPSIVHSWGYLSSALAAPLCKILKIKIVDGTIRSGSVSSRHRTRTRLTFLLSDIIIANSQAGLSSFRLSSDKGKVIYNGFDPERLSLIASYPKQKNNWLTVVMAARISIAKDFGTFIEAARKISQNDPNGWKFIILGVGESKAPLLQNAKDLILKGIMKIPDVGNEIIPYIKNADIGVLLTNSKVHEEGMSNSIMECMACGLPVISTDCGGNREIVSDGKTGFLIPPYNVEALVQKLMFFKDNPSIRSNMGEAGKKRLLELCNINRMVSEYISIYQQLLNSKHQNQVKKNKFE